MNQITIHRDNTDTLREHCERDHYLHRWPDPRSLPFGYSLEVDGQRYQSDGRLSGFVVMKKPQHNKQRGLFGYPGLPTSWQVLDLARVWVHPALQAEYREGRDRQGRPARHGLNIFSQMVGQVIRRVQADWLVHHPPVYPELPYHIMLIISYCEIAHHDGVAYRASGFDRFGFSSDRKKELYVRKLKSPRRSWTPKNAVQWPLFAEIPLVHCGGARV